MSIWRVRGKQPLIGSVKVQGAKNSVLPIIAASILTGCETELLNCPGLSDVAASIAILRHLGCEVTREGDVVGIDSVGLCRNYIPHELMREMRSSVIFLGAILGRCGEAVLAYPGGCELGPRPIDLHLDALKSMGAEITEQSGNILCRAKELHGARINFRLPSVGATENAMIAACAAKGETVITNAAREPEIVELQAYLRRLGADIHGAGTSTVVISGFTPVKRVGCRILPDRIVSATLLSAAAAAGGDIELDGVDPGAFETVTSALESMGCIVHRGVKSVRLSCRDRLKASRPIETKPHPGFPTDAQPTLMAACLKAEGTSVFIENIFENRFRHVDEMKRLGADISLQDKVAVVTGVGELYGAPVTTTDLRGGAALVVAALAAEGETIIYDTGHIDRGYEDLDRQLSELGADVCKEEREPAAVISA